MNKKTKKILTILSGTATAVICIVMNFILIPKIESTTEGIRCFDMNFAYSYETAQKFLSLLSDEGQRVYLNLQLPLDFIYPLMYCAFFILLLSYLTGKKAIFALPCVLALCDYTENILSIIMLKSASLTQPPVLFASCITSVKTVLMYLTFLVLIVLVVKKIIQRKKAV